MRTRTEELALTDVREIRRRLRLNRPSWLAGFDRELRTTRALIHRFPNAGTSIGDDTYRLLLGHLPYALFYRLEADWATIFAVGHLSRDENWWRGR